MAEKSPAFQFYVKDWLSSQRVRLMTPEQRGCYMDLLAHCWDGFGLPDDMLKLEKLSDYRGTDFEQKIWREVSQFFYKDRDGKFQNERLDSERKKQKDYSKKQSKKAKARWNKDLESMPQHSRGIADDTPLRHSNGNALLLQSSSAFPSASLKESLKEKPDFNFTEAQERQIFEAIADARGWSRFAESTHVAFRELMERVRKNKPDTPFAYALAAAKNEGKPIPKIAVQKPEEIAT